MEGEELSVFFITDGTNAIPLVPAQDHKRLLDGDRGPNTGGMGAYAPVSIVEQLPHLVDQIASRVVEPTLHELRQRGAPFTGLLYAGLMLTSDGPKVVEFNCRFGDPETQVVLPLLDSPLAGVLYAAATGTLSGAPPLVWRDGAAVTVVVASAGYPAAPRTGDPIGGADRPGVIHAGTRLAADGSLVSSGGRVLCATATGATLAEARDAAYALVDSITLAGSQHRTDIAAAAVAGAVRIPR